MEFLSARKLQNEAAGQFGVSVGCYLFWLSKLNSHLISKSMCGCGCSIISSLMKRLSRSTFCSEFFSCSHTPDQLQRLSIECPRQPKVTSEIYFKLKHTVRTDRCLITRTRWLKIKDQLKMFLGVFLTLQRLSNIILSSSDCVAMEMLCSNWFCNRIRWFTSCTDNHLLACSSCGTLMDVVIAAWSWCETAGHLKQQHLFLKTEEQFFVFSCLCFTFWVASNFVPNLGVPLKL